jgi:hypothetical protein
MAQNNLKFNREKATLILPLGNLPISERLIAYATENNYATKPEFHLTLLSFQNGKKILQMVDPLKKDQVLDRVLSIANDYSWSFELVPEYIVLERSIKEYAVNGKVETPGHTRRSIIQRMTVPDLSPFFARLSEELGIAFEIPFPHVTLFSWSDFAPEMNSGIAVNSLEDLDRLAIGQVVL